MHLICSRGKNTKVCNKMVCFSLSERPFNYGVNGWLQSLRNTHSEIRSNENPSLDKH